MNHTAQEPKSLQLAVELDYRREYEAAHELRTMQARIAKLEAQLYAISTVEVGQSIQPPVQADTAAPAQPPAATDEPQLNGDAQLAHQQCRAVAHLARSVANAYDVCASMVANDAQLANLIGETSAAAMERLGDELNSMDSASETDDWLNPIFDAAQQRWPGNETDAPQHAAQQKPVAWRVHPFDYGVGSKGVYALTMRPEQVEMWKRKGWRVEPLYTAPQLT